MCIIWFVFLCLIFIQVLSLFLSYSEEMEGKVVQAPLAIRIAKIPKAIDPKRGYEQVEI